MGSAYDADGRLLSRRRYDRNVATYEVARAAGRAGSELYPLGGDVWGGCDAIPPPLQAMDGGPEAGAGRVPGWMHYLLNAG